MSVALYSTPSCSYCRLAKDWLAQRNIRFEEYDISRDSRRAEEVVRKSGQMGVPVIDVNGQIIIGFNTAALEKALHR
ncbi:MAG: NrdH-redoxin [Spirochaetes bacterium GWD1_61_31]|nr:MAG: NrdH-redoxin [Pseudomonadales bacterium GWC1_66_9]OHD18688.1 MAG: NrdH-redoxin [Spirochaetes bacterium GWB1_60_80]OHD36910.1 MAG: NrdH-redoxin [Spirochaetes bacterium GWD1_61_31]OHD42624.1 MAG: NrdH-redoxin [Spirochaetes bacterium GWE1_60_18]OHD58006.1 MAG: NrdH-redoxin [Spirochaetes bacterium GWF1_60_12]HAP42623.1 NrdH-redoxin [Spirochaetaceae bacterium]